MTQPPTQEQVERIVAGLDSTQRELIKWLWCERHIDVLSKARLELIRNGVLHVITRNCAIYASLTPLGLAVRAHLITKGSDQ